MEKKFNLKTLLGFFIFRFQKCNGLRICKISLLDLKYMHSFSAGYLVASGASSNRITLTWLYTCQGNRVALCGPGKDLDWTWANHTIRNVALFYLYVKYIPSFVCIKHLPVDNTRNLCNFHTSLVTLYTYLRGYSTRNGPKNRIFLKNIYDVDNEFYEKEEGAMYGPGIADWSWVISFVCTVIVNL